MITLTDAASDKIRAMADEHKVDNAAIRVMVVGGGCSGLTYDMDFEEAAQEGDTVVEGEGDVKVFVDAMSMAYLDGTTIDFVSTFSYSGFHFENPNAKKGCGCGKSFTV